MQWPPTVDAKYKAKTTTPANARTTISPIPQARKLARNLGGPNIANIAMVTVMVYNSDIAVLMVTIRPNLAKSCIWVRHKGIAARIVVMAELIMDMPICDIAALALH